jgi:transcriptional regulator of heat shock response
VTPSEVESAQKLVTSVVVGEELGHALGLDDEKLGGLDEPTREAALTITDCLHLAATAGTEVYVGGTQKATAVWQDLTTVQRVLDILEREAEVMKMLAGASGTSIQMGSDIDPSDIDLAVVSKSYDASGEAGSLGVIGPMRMNYKRAISAVEEVTRELEEQIGQRADGS